MGSSEFIRSIGDVGFAVAAVSANLFVLLYAMAAPWWKTPFGRHLFLFMAAVALVFNSAVANIFFPDWEGRWVLRAIVYPLMGVAMLWRVIILIDVQIVTPWREKRREERENRTEMVH